MKKQYKDFYRFLWKFLEEGHSAMVIKPRQCGMSVFAARYAAWCLDYKDMGVKKKGVISSWICPQLWQRMVVLWDGTILPCNHDDELLMSLGNIKNISIKESWNSDKLNNLRDKHKKKLSHNIKACNGCF